MSGGDEMVPYVSSQRRAARPPKASNRGRVPLNLCRPQAFPTATQIGVFATTACLARHDRWTPERLRAYQDRRLQELRTYTYAHSPFYRRFHAGGFDRPLAELPVLTRQALYEATLLTPTGSAPRHECLTSGTMGEHVHRCVYDHRGWRMVLASFARARTWAGLPIRPWPGPRTAVVASGNRTHQSGAVAAALAGGWAPLLSLDAGAPLHRLVAQLNTWRPDVIVAYPSIAVALGAEQQAGRLNMQPRLLISVAEVLSQAARERLQHAWHCPVVDHYAATEMGCIAAECSQHTGLHLQEDLAIVEVVDECDRPVPAGKTGAKVLLTVLFNFAMPLIRYAIHDRVVLAAHPCACGRPFRLIERIEGRHEELVTLPSQTGGTVTMHPVALYEVLDTLPVRSWSLTVGTHEIVVGVDSANALPHRAIAGRLGDVLRQRGIVPPPIRIKRVDVIARTTSRKRLSTASSADQGERSPMASAGGHAMLDVIRSRRSVRRYTTQPVDRALVDRLLDAARWAPSNWNGQPWVFLVIDKPELIERVYAALDARALAVRDAHPTDLRLQRFIDHCRRYFHVLRECPVLVAACYRPVGQIFERAVGEHFADPGGVAAWSPHLLSLGMAVQNLLLCAHAEGLGACFHSGPVAFLRGGLHTLLDLPTRLELAGFVTLGWPSAEPTAAVHRKPLNHVVRWMEVCKP